VVFINALICLTVSNGVMPALTVIKCKMNARLEGSSGYMLGPSHIGVDQCAISCLEDIGGLTILKCDHDTVPVID